MSNQLKFKKMQNNIGILAIILAIAAAITGCVVSINVQKNNSNSSQSVEQSANAQQKNDSINFKMEQK